MQSVAQRSGIEMIDREGCLELLASRPVGRLAFVQGGRPEVLPVNYALDGDAIVFVTASTSALWGATEAPVVFEVDDVDPAARSGWSVVVHGLAQEITDLDSPAVVTRVRAAAPVPWAPGGRQSVVRIAPRSITGRRVGVVKEAVS